MDPIDRRRFLLFAPLCCTTPLLPPASFSRDGRTVVLDLRLAPELRKPGTARALVDAERKLNLIVIHVSKHRFVALDRSCTHGGAQCTYNARHQTVQCTSLNHAEYGLDGMLLHGRTHGNLRSYPVACRGPRLEISLA